MGKATKVQLGNLPAATAQATAQPAAQPAPQPAYKKYGTPSTNYLVFNAQGYAALASNGFTPYMAKGVGQCTGITQAFLHMVQKGVWAVRHANGAPLTQKQLAQQLHTWVQQNHNAYNINLCGTGTGSGCLGGVQRICGHLSNMQGAGAAHFGNIYANTLAAQANG